MRCSHPLRKEAGLALLLATFTLLLLSLHRSPPTCPHLKEQPRAPKAPDWPSPHFRPPPAPCRPNTSMTTLPDFAGQPRHIRDFLLYKHCRDFALLQEVPPDKCADPVFLLLVIKSSPSNYERRELVRRTWGRERQILGVQLRRLFLVGTDSKPLEARKVNRLLAMEAQTHGDILQWDFYDTFFNLTLKQVAWGWGGGRGGAGWGVGGVPPAWSHRPSCPKLLPSPLRGPGDQKPPHPTPATVLIVI